VQSPTRRDSTLHTRNQINALVERLSLTRVAAVIPVSHTLETYAREQRIVGRHISMVPNGVPARGPLVERPAPAGDWTIVTVALFRPRKGLDILLRAFAKLRAAGQPVRLRAVGSFETAEYETQIKALARELGIEDAIDWCGFCHDVSSELARMDLFVLPSLFGEGLPFVILEAMAAGIPVISTNVEGIPEAVRDGREGLIVEPGDADDLARAMQRFVSGEVDWQAVRHSAWQRQGRHYTDETMSRGVAAVYDTVLGSPALTRIAS
jgi:glycosyltransferase involved in cell wall biosynthesis